MARTDSRSDPLQDYRSRRRFDRTPEPKGGARSSKGQLYTIQMHGARRLHYDLRLELDGVLKSWAVTKGPSLDPSEKRLAVRTEDHPLEYATFEGVIPEGNYGAGPVALWDRGRWEPVGDPHEGLNKGKLAFELHGERLHGRWALVRMRGDRKSRRENWLLIKERDDEADRGRDVTAEFETSVASGRGLDDIASDPDATWQGEESGEDADPASPAPKFVEPALATLVDEVPAGEGWLFEVKFDGYRAISSVSGGIAVIRTRGGHDWTDRFPSIARALARLNLDGALLDGEIVAIDKSGRSDFSALQRALDGNGSGVAYFVFDLLAEKGRSLRGRPLVERKKRLETLLGERGRKGPVFFTDHVEDDGRGMLDELCRTGHEGVIAKKAKAPYRSGRGRAWLKVKCRRDQEFVVVGWSPSDKDRPFASLLLATDDGEGLRYAGRIGTGFSEADLDRIAGRLRKLERKTPPVGGSVPSQVRRNARWARPELVVQVAFAEFTRDGLVRQGRFLGLREDKPASDVRREAAPSPRESGTVNSKPQSSKPQSSKREDTVAGVRLTHPDRVLFPDQGVTKRELARYLERAADRMLPYVSHRLISLVRCPEGRAKSCFFQRHGGAGLSDRFVRHGVTEKDGSTEDYLYIKDAAALVEAAQMGVLEFHIWGSRVDDIERPDRLVFDLDPDPSVDFDEVKRAAVLMRDALDALGLRSFALLTGGKGIHVVAPLIRRHGWRTVKAFAAALADRFVEDDPDRFVATMSKARRKGRVFIDHFRNDRMNTAIAPYSPRARKGAPLAWPVTWSDLDGIPASDVHRLPDADPTGPDPWKDYGSVRQSLKAASLRALGVGED